MKKLILKLKIWWFWFGNRPQKQVSDKWSNELQSLIDEGCIFTNITEFHATFGKYELWTANQPYSSFVEYRDCFHGGLKEYMPNKWVGYQLCKIYDKSINIKMQNDLLEFERGLD